MRAIPATATRGNWAAQIADCYAGAGRLSGPRRLSRLTSRTLARLATGVARRAGQQLSSALLGAAAGRLFASAVQRETERASEREKDGRREQGQKTGAWRTKILAYSGGRGREIPNTEGTVGGGGSQ